MNVQSYKFNIKTSRREQFLQVGDDINDFIEKSQVQNGLVKIFVPHTTAGIIVNQNANPDVLRDIQLYIDEILPKHPMLNVEGNSDSHFKCALFGVSIEIPIEKGKMALGEWQGVFFCEFDGPRTRKIQLQIWGFD